ncbi:MAG TPA: tRNA 5-methoxyuridine(34)/uridine 5-oxyacetic acid(34) synthase CmoB [Bacteroidetes bacterium]|nr:tRNA 5-methoxyuridine(34)/uridine 5-oxyacetic acid(34) synthase CmoB [Bacteroidota bacterium]HRR07867.1 tRNA 5-methoxyuridine(34)/uridine 5-oxyacetic acid(34) synthase CmoB [Rhodothermales bacterium]
MLHLNAHSFLQSAYQYLAGVLPETPLQKWDFRQDINMLKVFRHGDFPRWSYVLNEVQHVATHWEAQGPIALFGENPLSPEEEESFIRQLQELHPWRKGPYELFGVKVETEWRSDMKWSRIYPHLSPLNDRMVLDVGSGNGFYGWHMIKAGARQVLGVDPFLLFVLQWALIAKMIPLADRFRNVVLPFGVEAIPKNCMAFDTVFSMGVLYHRRDTKQHLSELLGFLRDGGEVVLETLILEGDDKRCLYPPNRYAKMRNVWAIPTIPLLKQWMYGVGFQNVRTVDVTRTTVQEQRRTDWMTFESLSDFLDPEDAQKTIEGHPAPVRAVLLANR